MRRLLTLFLVMVISLCLAGPAAAGYKGPKNKVPKNIVLQQGDDLLILFFQKKAQFKNPRLTYYEVAGEAIREQGSVRYPLIGSAFPMGNNYIKVSFAGTHFNNSGAFHETSAITVTLDANQWFDQFADGTIGTIRTTTYVISDTGQITYTLPTTNFFTNTVVITDSLSVSDLLDGPADQ